jgi:hypothetical protein
VGGQALLPAAPKAKALEVQPNRCIGASEARVLGGTSVPESWPMFGPCGVPFFPDTRAKAKGTQ